MASVYTSTVSITNHEAGGMEATLGSRGLIPLDPFWVCLELFGSYLDPYQGLMEYV